MSEFHRRLEEAGAELHILPAYPEEMEAPYRERDAHPAKLSLQASPFS